jgi:uncharacterized protein YbjT (DUF2867 family)
MLTPREEAMKPKILITGATGKTGLPLAGLLAEKKVPFRALVHSPLKEPILKKWTPDVMVGDYNDKKSMENAFEGIEKVYLVSPPAPDQYRVQTALVDIAKKEGVNHIVKLSALGTSVKSPVGLLKAHAEIEEYIKKSGIAWTFLHAHYFMENFLGNAESVIKEGAIYSPLGDATISAISVHDIAAVAAEVLTGTGHEGKTYTLTGPESLGYWDIASILGRIIGKTVLYVPVTFETARNSMLQAGMPEWFAGDIIRLMKTWTEGKGSKVSHDVEMLIERKPISLREFFECHKDLFIGKAGKAA